MSNERTVTSDDSDEARARREAFYDKQCWCGHAMGNHMLVTGECLLCDHATTARQIREENRRHGF